MIDLRTLNHLLDRGRFSWEIKTDDWEIILETPSQREEELMVLLSFFDLADFLILVYRFKTRNKIFIKNRDLEQFWLDLEDFIKDNYEIDKLSVLTSYVEQFYKKRKEFFKVGKFERSVLNESIAPRVIYWVSKVWPIKLANGSVKDFSSDIFELIDRVQTSEILAQYYTITAGLEVKREDRQKLLYTLIGRSLEQAMIQKIWEKINRGD